MNHRLVSAIFVYKKLLLAVMLVIFSLLVGACGAVEQDVTLIKNEKWKAETRLILNKQTIALANPSDIEQRLDAAQAQADAAEVSYKWNKKINDDGGVTYIIRTSGTGYDLLNNVVFDGGAIINTLDEDGTTEFSLSSIGDFSDYKLVLHVGEVLETNGVVSGKGDVSWHGMGLQMHAVIKPKSGFNVIWLLVGAGLILLVIMVVYFFIRTRSPSRPAVSNSPTYTAIAKSSQPGYGATNYCYRCGGKLNPNGEFCPHCGAPIF